MSLAQALSDLYWEGLSIDLWTVPHALFGLVVYFGVLKYNLGNFRGFVLTFLLAAGWEFGEFMLRVNEAVSNTVMDILISVIVYMLAWFFVSSFKINKHQTKKGFIFAITLLIITSTIGWVREYVYYNTNFLN